MSIKKSGPQINKSSSLIKYCTKCLVILNGKNWIPSMYRKRRYRCKSCENAQRKTYPSYRSAKIRGYYKNHPEKYRDHLDKMKKKRHTSEEARLAYNAYMRDKQRARRERMKTEGK